VTDNAAQSRLARPVLETDRLTQPAGVDYEEKPGYWVLRTRPRPDYLGGNALAALAPVRAADLDRLVSAWRREFSHDGLHHAVIQWEESLDGRTPAALEAEFRDAAPHAVLLPEVALKLAQLREPPRPAHLHIGLLSSDADWQQLLAMSIEEEDHPLATAEFVTWQIGAYRQRERAGDADWWGAWDGSELVAGSGVFRGSSVIRIEEVRTRRAHRGRGVGRALCYRAISQAMAASPQAEVWVVAEEDSVAQRMYESLGFRPARRKWTLLLEQPREEES
jgi:ribosomal protein S18 acetylase RimI-like enzyme